MVLLTSFSLSTSTISPIEIKASFEKAIWFLDPILPMDKKELVSSSLMSAKSSKISSKALNTQKT